MQIKIPVIMEFQWNYIFAIKNWYYIGLYIEKSIKIEKNVLKKKTHNETPLPTHQDGYKKQKQTNKQNPNQEQYADKDVEKLEHLYTVGGNLNCCSCCEKQYGGSLKS